MNNQKSKKKRKIGWIILACVVVVVAVIAAVVWDFYQAKLNLLQYDDGRREMDTEIELPLDDVEIPDLGDAPEDDQRNNSLPTGDMVTDDNVINIMLLGTDERSKNFSDNARADTIMILSLNTQTHAMKLVSIERGIGVPVPGRNDDWITHTFRYGGAALTMQTVRDCFKVDVDRYIRVNFYAFEAGIDAIGGIDINLTQDEVNYLKQYGKIYDASGKSVLQVGINHVDGATALTYARIRKIDSDWKRIERQRNVIQAALNQVVQADVRTLNKLADTILPMIQTNLTKNEITELLLEVPAFLSAGAQMDQMTIPTKDTCWNSVGIDGRKMIAVDFEANAKILKDFFYGE